MRVHSSFIEDRCEEERWGLHFENMKSWRNLLKTPKTKAMLQFDKSWILVIPLSPLLFGIAALALTLTLILTLNPNPNTKPNFNQFEIGLSSTKLKSLY